MKAAKPYLIITVLLGLAGCAAGPQVQVNALSSTRYAPTSLVETLSKAPDRPYTAIANIHAEAPTGTPPAQVIAIIEKRAAALGADAVILHNESRSTPAQVQFNPSGGNYQNLPPQLTPIYSGEAIRWSSSSK
ncbi:hypothetical protein [Acidithiobacillus sp.]